MAIDYTKPVALLVRLKIHDANGDPATLYWCGPKAVTQGGLLAEIPDASSATEIQWWETRVRGAQLDNSMGGLLETAGKIPLFSFDVEIGDDEADATLLDLALTGYWAGKEVDVWEVQVTKTGGGLAASEATPVWKGTINRRGNVRLGGFSLTVDGGATALDQPLPTMQAPADTSGYTASSGTYVPNQWYVSPEDAGKHFTKVIVSSGGVWIRAFPFGRTADSGNHKVFAWIGPGDLTDGGVWCSDMYQEDSLADGFVHVGAPTGPGEFVYVNDDATKGPIGTCVKFTSTTSASNAFNWWEGRFPKLWCKVEGLDVGQIGTSPELTGTGTAREDADEALEDIVEDSRLLNLGSSIWGTNALSDWASAYAGTADSFDGSCAVLPEPTEEPPTLRDFLRDMMQALQSDVVMKYDATAGDMRFFPIVRGPTSASATPDHTIKPWDLARRDPPSWVAMHDPKREEANEVVLEGPEYLSIFDSSTDNALDEVTRNHFVGTHSDDTEQGATKRNEVLFRRIKLKHWGSDTTGHDDLVDQVGRAYSQPQLWTTCQVGLARGRQLDLGDLIAFGSDVRGAPSATGQIRRLRTDYDRGIVTVESVHIVHS